MLSGFSFNHAGRCNRHLFVFVTRFVSNLSREGVLDHVSNRFRFSLCVRFAVSGETIMRLELHNAHVIQYHRWIRFIRRLVSK